MAASGNLARIPRRPHLGALAAPERATRATGLEERLRRCDINWQRRHNRLCFAFLARMVWCWGRFAADSVLGFGLGVMAHRHHWMCAHDNTAAH